ncbi:5'-nucleotidase, lipoprotein e(P4) family [Zavarzinella formosa]|uniref:5'-nucleotidase, lipoprotein e(P4) family n=1 Tax=Zavarzinella formosa TaxID=360055 RepID=UPI0002E0734B|nr:HAD family acid phosphatase [Zavarzinella formosa]
MRKITPVHLILACSTCLCVGWLAGDRGMVPLAAEPLPVKKADAPALPMPSRMAANVYLQTSAEYRACCLQVYRTAGQQLLSKLKSGGLNLTKPAIIMDLDETVLDNSAFQTFLYKNNLEYTDDLWAEYEETAPQDVTLIPGAKAFIDMAEGLGVTVIYISNRTDKFKSKTIEALENLKINVKGIADRIHLKAEKSSDKSARREAVAAKYNVMMLFGDNLRDFSEAFAAPKLPKEATTEDYCKAIKQRLAAADDAACHWGVDWFVLPNPVYGEWDRITGPEPLAVLHPTSMRTKQPAK